MSQTSIYAEVYIEEKTRRQTLIDALSDGSETISLTTDVIDLEQVFFDDVISIQGMSGSLIDCEKELRVWLKSYKPDIAVIRLCNDYGNESFGLKKNRKVSCAKAMESLMSVSERIETALKIETSSQKDLLQYFKKNSVSATEKFQGISHIDRCAQEKRDFAIEYFIDNGLEPHHKITYYRTASQCQRFLAFEYMHDDGFALVKKLIDNGFDVNTRDEDCNLLLHYIDEDSLVMCKYLIDKGCDVDARNNRGETPLLEVVRHFCSAHSDENIEDEPELFDSITEVIDLLIQAGASLNVFDKNGAGLLLYARHHKELKNWITAKVPKLSPYSEDADRNKALVSLIKGGRYQLRFYENCLEEQITSVFYEPEFLDFFNSASDKTAIDKLKTAMLFGSQFVELFCRYDRADLLQRLQDLGFPILSPCYGIPGFMKPAYSSGCSYEYAKKCNSEQVLNYMAAHGVDEDLVCRMESDLEQWLQQSRAAKDDISYIELHSSPRWRKSVSNRRKTDEHIQRCFSNIVRESANKHMNYIWGNNLFLGDNSLGFSFENKKFKVLSQDEIFERITLSLE